MLWCLQYNVQLTLKFLFCLPKLLQFRKVLVQDEHFREAQSGHDGCQLIEWSTNQSMWSRTLKALFKHKFVVGRRKALRVSTDFRDWNAHANIQRVFCVVPRYVQVRSIAKRPLRTMLLCIGMVDCGDCVGFLRTSNHQSVWQMQSQTACTIKFWFGEERASATIGCCINPWT